MPAGPLEGMPRRHFGFALLHKNDSDFNQNSSNNETAHWTKNDLRDTLSAFIDVQNLSRSFITRFIFCQLTAAFTLEETSDVQFVIKPLFWIFFQMHTFFNAC